MTCSSGNVVLMRSLYKRLQFRNCHDGEVAAPSWKLLSVAMRGSRR